MNGRDKRLIITGLLFGALMTIGLYEGKRYADARSAAMTVAAEPGPGIADYRTCSGRTLPPTRPLRLL